MTDSRRVSRRGFVKAVGGLAGAAAVPAEAWAQSPVPASAQVPGPVQPALSLGNVANYPGLTSRGAGWLRFLWEKATTRDNWTSNGVPHPWWDRYTAPVVLSYGRFDLSFSAYSLLLMADQTPAWREVYTRIADELTARYPTYWGAIDWLTQIGDDPKRANYPPGVMGGIPERLRGRYNRFGWTANGIEPWGLQPDPVGADGYLFFRAWFLLLLATYKYVSGDDKWAQPFDVVGYGDETFQWDTHRIAERLESQYREHPEGPHCENTKIWVFCNSAGGLGMLLYDRVFGRSTHQAFENFIGYARENYITIGSNGALERITSYYDPIEDFHFGGAPGGGLNTAHLMLPQNRELGTLIYDAAANAAGWRTGTADLSPNTNGLILAQELGDAAVYERLRAAAERANDPRAFGAQQEQFGWFFNNNEAYPRGQGCAMLMAAEVASPGDWSRAFEAPHLDKYTAPTVEGIDFPSLGVSQAWNNPTSGVLHVATYAAAPDRRGAETSWRVTNLPSTANLTVRLNGQPFTRFEVTGPGTIRIDSTIDAHQFEIVTGYRGVGAGQASAPEVEPAVRGAAAASVLATGIDRAAGPDPFMGSPGCPCCASAGGAKRSRQLPSAAPIAPRPAMCTLEVRTPRGARMNTGRFARIPRFDRTFAAGLLVGALSLPTASSAQRQDMAAMGPSVNAPQHLFDARDFGIDPASVTFSKDIAPILQRSCQNCHRPDGAGPMSLITYQDVRRYAQAIARRTAIRDRMGSMPPWYVEKDIGIQHYKNDPSLSDEELAKIQAWVANGAPEGNPADLPPPREWGDAGAWTIRPDLVVRSSDIVVEGGAADWWGEIESIPIPLETDRYVRAVQIREVNDVPTGGTGRETVGGRYVVHHVIWSTRVPGAPQGQTTSWPVHEVGRNADVFAEEAGRLLRAGSEVVSESMHLHSNGRTTKANLEIGFELFPEGYEPAYRGGITSLANGTDIDIEAGLDGQRLDAYTVVQRPTKIISFEPHLHAPGERMCLEAIWGFKAETLACVGYDHNWVRTYVFQEEYQPLIPTGAILHITGYMNNSETNPNVADPRNWQGAGNRSVANMFIDLGERVTMTEEQFVEEVRMRVEQHGLTKNDYFIGCPLCLAVVQTPGATPTAPPPAP